MKRLVKVFNKIVKDLSKFDEDEQFNAMFILTCMLIYRLSCGGKHLDLILKLLNEFDYKKNFESEEE